MGEKDEVSAACALDKEETAMEFKEDLKKDSEDEVFGFME